MSWASFLVDFFSPKHPSGHPARKETRNTKATLRTDLDPAQKSQKLWTEFARKVSQREKFSMSLFSANLQQLCMHLSHKVHT
jgi:hypothetical protein